MPTNRVFCFFFFFWKFVICLSVKQYTMKFLLILDFSSQTPCLAKFFFWSYCPKFSWPIRLQDSSKCNICKKTWEIKLNQVDFLFAAIRVSYKIVLLVLISMVRHAQSIQNNKYTISLEYFEKELKDKLYISCRKINIKVFNMLVVLFLLVMAKRTQST